MGKKQEIVKSATRLFADQGFDSITTLQIVRAAGVTGPSLYYHFKGKDELFITIRESTLAGYLSRLETLNLRALTPFERIEQLVELHFRFADEMPGAAHLVLCTCPAKLKDPDHVCTGYMKKIREWLTIFFEECRKDGIRSGELNPVPVETTADLIIARINGLLRRTTLRNEHRNGIKDTVIEFCSRSLVKNAPDTAA